MLPLRRPLHASLLARLALLAVPFAVGACMTLQKGAQVKATPPGAPDTGGLVLVLSGGFNSCDYNKVTVDGETDEQFYKWSPYGLSMLPQFNQLTRDILRDRPSAPLRWVISCFGTDLNHLRYYTSSHPKPSELRMVDHAHENAFVEDVLNEARLAGPDPTVVVIGHSWGGSLAMHVTRALATAPAADRIKELGLATIDPISRMPPDFGCNPSTFFKILWPFSDTQTRCRQAPVIFADDMLKDTDPVAVGRRADIVNGVKEMFWLNYYQENFRFLHSSEVPVASMNGLKVMKTFLNPIAPHTEIPLRPDIWAEIKARTMARFGATAPAAAVMAPAFAAPVGRDAEETKQLDLNDRLTKALAELSRYRASEEDVAERGFHLRFAGDLKDPSKPVLVIELVYWDQATLDAKGNAAAAIVRTEAERIAAEARKPMVDERGKPIVDESGKQVPGPLEGIAVRVEAPILDRASAPTTPGVVQAASVGGPARRVAPQAPQGPDARAGVVFAAPENDAAPGWRAWVEGPQP